MTEVIFQDHPYSVLRKVSMYKRCLLIQCSSEGSYILRYYDEAQNRYYNLWFDCETEVEGRKVQYRVRCNNCNNYLQLDKENAWSPLTEADAEATGFLEWFVSEGMTVAVPEWKKVYTAALD